MSLRDAFLFFNFKQIPSLQLSDSYGKKEQHLVMAGHKPPIFSNNCTISDDYLKYKIRDKGQETIWLVVLVGDKRLFQREVSDSISVQISND